MREAAFPKSHNASRISRETEDVGVVMKALSSCPTNLLELIIDYNALRFRREGKLFPVQVEGFMISFEDTVQVFLDVYLPVCMDFIRQMGIILNNYAGVFGNFRVDAIAVRSKRCDAFGSLLLSLTTAMSEDIEKLHDAGNKSAKELTAEVKAASAQEKEARKNEAAKQAPFAGLLSLLRGDTPAEMQAQEVGKILQDLRAVREAKAILASAKSLLAMMSRFHQHVTVVAEYYTRINAVMTKYVKLALTASDGQLNSENLAALERHHAKMRSPGKHLEKRCIEFQSMVDARKEMIADTSYHLQCRPGKRANIVAQNFLRKHSTALNLKKSMDGKTGWLVVRHCTRLDVAPPDTIYWEVRLDNTSNPTKFLAFEFTASEFLSRFRTQLTKPADNTAQLSTGGLDILSVSGDTQIEICKFRKQREGLLLLEAAPRRCVKYLVALQATGGVAAYRI